MVNSPQLLFIAGPNGAGKSTFSKDLSHSDALIFDPDKETAIIAQRFANLPKESIRYAFQQHFEDFVELAIRNKRSFVIETNFRDHSLMDTAYRFKTNGYETSMLYLVLRGIPESTDRVTHRVANGGHYIDDNSILYNYNEGLKNLEYFAGRFDNLEILNASGNYLQLKSLLSIQKQKLVFLSSDLPEWIRDLIERIASRFPDNSLNREDDKEIERPRGPRR